MHLLDSTKLYIGTRQRVWAMTRQYQNFFGCYELHEACGLYFAQGSSEAHIELVCKAFKQLPFVLQKLCYDWQVTFSFAAAHTAIGSASAFYADFAASSRELISPHIEMSEQSLDSALVLPHLAHEISHLFWRSRTEREKLAYRKFLELSCHSDTVEITSYVQQHYTQYLDSVAKLESGACESTSHEILAKRWAQESFCDTVAARVFHLAHGVSIDAKAYTSQNCNVDMTLRLMAMHDCFGLEI